MQELTEEQLKDIEERVKGFREKYIEMVAEFEVDFVSYPQYQQTSEGFFVTIPTMQIVDKKYLPEAPIISPFVEQE